MNLKDLSKGELIALHKTIMFAKFPLESDRQREISGSLIVYDLLKSIRQELDVWKDLPLKDYPDYLAFIKESLSDSRLKEQSKEVRVKIVKLKTYPFLVDEKLKEELLNLTQ